MYALEKNSPEARIANQRQRVDELSHRITSRARQLIALEREQLNGAVRQLGTLNPEATLGRGYAIVQEKENGRVIKWKLQAAGRKKIQIRVSDGEFQATTDE